MQGIPELLISVRNAVEAAEAHAGGAVWIDLKEPLAGPLGIVSPEAARQAISVLPPAKPVTAALGELSDWHYPTIQPFLMIPELQVLKLGLAGCLHKIDWQRQWASLQQCITESGKQLAAVIYADEQQAAAPAAQDVLSTAISHGCQFLLIDTFDKRGGSLLNILPYETLANLLAEARQAGMRTVVAGSLGVTDLPRLAGLTVDVLAVRGSVCRPDRTGRLSANQVSWFCQAIHATWQPVSGAISGKV